MTFQSSVALDIGFGVVGELFLDGPLRAQPGIIDSVGTTPAFNRVGRAFTKVAAADGHCVVGGTPAEGAQFFGILANPKVYPSLGTTGGGTLAPSLDLPQNATGEFVQETSGLIVHLEGAANVGDAVDFVAADGTLVARAKSNSFTGIIAVTTGILTVSGFVAGGAPIAVGSLLSGGTTPPGTYVTAFIGGTGGNGTYQTSIVTAVASTPMSSTSQPVAGNIEIPNAKVTRYSISGAGNAVIAIAAGAA